MKILSLLIVLVLSACAMEQKHSGTVYFKIAVDEANMIEFFEPVCKKEMPEADPAVLTACVKLKIGQFLDAVSAIAGVTPQ